MATDDYSTDDTHTLLARIDERTRGISARLAALEAQIEKTCVTRVEFAPVQRIAYGSISIILSLVMGGLMMLVLRKP